MAGKRFTATRMSYPGAGGVDVTVTSQAGDSGVYLTIDDTLTLSEAAERVRCIILDWERRQSDAAELVSGVPTGANGY